jgi:hypothetical protein
MFLRNVCCLPPLCAALWPWRLYCLCYNLSHELQLQSFALLSCNLWSENITPHIVQHMLYGMENSWYGRSEQRDGRVGTNNWTNSIELSPFLDPPVAQLLKNFATFYGTWSFITMLSRVLLDESYLKFILTLSFHPQLDLPIASFISAFPLNLYIHSNC